MLRPKDKWHEVAAFLCGTAALIAYFVLGNPAIGFLAVLAGVAILAWSYLDVGR